MKPGPGGEPTSVVGQWDGFVVIDEAGRLVVWNQSGCLRLYRRPDQARYSMQPTWRLQPVSIRATAFEVVPRGAILPPSPDAIRLMAGVRRATDVVLGLFINGRELTAGQVIEATNLNKDAVRTKLWRLIQNGMLERVRRGVYRRTAA